jgi:hypothetical protein
MTFQRPPELPDLTVIEPTFEGPGSQPMVPVPHLPVPPEDPAGIDNIHGPAPRRQQKPATPSPPPQPSAHSAATQSESARIPDLLPAKQIAESDRLSSWPTAQATAPRSPCSGRMTLLDAMVPDWTAGEIKRRARSQGEGLAAVPSPAPALVTPGRQHSLSSGD